MLASQWVWQRTKSVIIPAEEQSAGCVVGYFYRVEFHSTRRFFSDSNYLFYFYRGFLKGGWGMGSGHGGNTTELIVTTGRADFD